MGTRIRVDLGRLARSSGALGGVGDTFQSLRSRLVGLEAVADASVASGFEQVRNAYSLAVNLLGEDVALIAERIAAAGVRYQADQDVQTAAFSSPSPTGPTTQ